MSLHSVFVLSQDGTPLTPTTPARARRLLQGGQAKPVWSKLGTFGIQMRVPTRHEQPRTGIGVDHGVVAEGYAVVCGTENVLALQLALPAKAQIVRKLTERRTLRRSRRGRKTRRRPKRFQNRRRKPGWIAPSQLALVLAREKMLRTLVSMYPITVAGVEEACFDHLRHRWGATFSSVEIGKDRLRQWYRDQGINAAFYRGHETQTLRLEYGYTKSSDKRAARFSAHCSDALALAAVVTTGARVQPGRWLMVDDSYRPVMIPNRPRVGCVQPIVAAMSMACAKGCCCGQHTVRKEGCVASIRAGIATTIRRGNAARLPPWSGCVATTMQQRACAPRRCTLRSPAA